MLRLLLYCVAIRPDLKHSLLSAVFVQRGAFKCIKVHGLATGMQICIGVWYSNPQTSKPSNKHYCTKYDLQSDAGISCLKWSVQIKPSFLAYHGFMKAQTRSLSPASQGLRTLFK